MLFHSFGAQDFERSARLLRPPARRRVRGPFQPLRQPPARHRVLERSTIRRVSRIYANTLLSPFFPHYIKKDVFIPSSGPSFQRSTGSTLSLISPTFLFVVGIIIRLILLAIVSRLLCKKIRFDTILIGFLINFCSDPLFGFQTVDIWQIGSTFCC